MPGDEPRRAPRLLLLDNIDSFTFMLADTLRQAGADVTVKRHDALSISDAMSIGEDGIVVSPGPGTPEQAGISVPLASACLEERRPYLGVCLGHQALALACGSEVIRTDPMHGKVASVRHDGTGLFAGLPSPFRATRYHSLAVDVPIPPLSANAWSDDGVVMALQHLDRPAYGLQFHPESVASEYGVALLAAFTRLASRTA